jgi:hypothetical protein
LQFLRYLVAFSLKRPPAALIDDPQLITDFGQAQIRVVLAQTEPIFRTAREHSVRLADAPRNQVIH